MGDGGGLPFTLHANLGSNSLVRRKLRMGAKTVGSLSMKICGKGCKKWTVQRVGLRGDPVPSYPPPHFRSRPTHGSRLIFQSRDASAQETAGRGHSADVTGRGVCLRGEGVRCPPTSSSHPTPPPLTRAPHHLEKKESGIQVRVCREVLNLCGECERMEMM